MEKKMKKSTLLKRELIKYEYSRPVPDWQCKSMHCLLLPYSS